MIKIIKNAIKCKTCGDIIESKHVHDFKFCSCQRVAVDGGHEYLRRCYTNSQDDFEELSESIEVEDDEQEKIEDFSVISDGDSEYEEFLRFTENIKKKKGE